MAEWIVVISAIGGIIWNAATLHNDVRHLKKDIEEIKTELQKIRDSILELAQH